MPDPQRDLAPIIALPPAQPAPKAAGHGPELMLLGLLCAGVLLVAAIAWRRHRSAPIRATRRLARSSDPRAAADVLARLLAAHGIAPEPAWRDDLERLRFGRPGPDEAATLARLCHAAEAVLRRQR